MRHTLLLLLVAFGAWLSLSPAQAVGTRYPFCIQGDEHPGLSNCTFTSYEQCAATASGRNLWCIRNPFYVGDKEPAAPAYDSVPPPPGYRR